MKEYTGNAKVDLMAQIQLTGNVTPQIWYKTITRPNGKPYLLAIAILSDIAYWYRPVEIRDEGTGHITGYRKKFKSDILQRSYDQFAELFGESKRSITEAVICLENLGVIRRVFRTIEVGGMKYNNVLFIDFFPERLFEITYPEELCEYSQSKYPVPEFRDRGHKDEKALSPNLGTGVTEKRDRYPEIPWEGSQNFGGRNTKITTENTTENTSSSFKASEDEDGTEADDDETIIKKYMAATEGVCPPEVVGEVISELKKHDNIHAVSPPVFLQICRNITEHASESIANKSAYVSRCIENMLAGQNLTKSAYRIRADSSNRRLLEESNLEQAILSNL